MNTYLKFGDKRHEYFQLELDCLERLSFSSHVPDVLDVDYRTNTILLQYAGKCPKELQIVNQKVKIKDKELQLNRIIEDLKLAKVHHLDVNYGNILINRFGKLSIIDFTHACIDENPVTPKLKKRLIKLKAAGEYDYTYKTWLDILNTVDEDII